VALPEPCHRAPIPSYAPDPINRLRCDNEAYLQLGGGRTAIRSAIRREPDADVAQKCLQFLGENPEVAKTPTLELFLRLGVCDDGTFTCMNYKRAKKTYAGDSNRLPDRSYTFP